MTKYYDYSKMIRPQFGIDKIKVCLIADKVDTNKFNDVILSINNPYNIYTDSNRLAITKQGVNYFLIINQEYFDFSLNMKDDKTNILLKIGEAILDIRKHGFLTEEPNPLFQNDGLMYLDHISEVEFYFDHTRKDGWFITTHSSSTIDEAKHNHTFYRYTDENNQITDTYYSWDYIPETETRSRKVSCISIYDKEKKDLETIIRKAGITVEEQKQVILAHPFKTRLEFRLSHENCQYLNTINFNGTYNQVLRNYSELLAVLYNAFCRNNIQYQSGSNLALDRIIRKAKTVTTLTFKNKEDRLTRG